MMPSLDSMIAELVSIPSVSSSDPEHDMGNLDAADCVRRWLDPLGFNCQLSPLTSNSKKANLIATLGPEGRLAEGLVLSGHLDTVPYDKDDWTTDPFELIKQNGRLYGLGTADMKAFLAIAAHCAAEFKDKNLKVPLTILATADEESGMGGAIELAQHSCGIGRMAVIGEPTGMIPVRCHKGILMERIRVMGKTGHSSNPAHGLNAIEGMHRIITALLEFTSELQNEKQNAMFRVPVSTLNLGRISGGDSPNRIPASTQLDLDLRYLPGMDYHEIRTRLREQCRTVLQKTEYQIEFDTLFEGIPAFETPVDAEIVRLCESLTGQISVAVDFATEGPYFEQMGMQSVILGPGGVEQAHQPDEYVAIEAVRKMQDIVRRLITQVCL